MDQKPSYPVQPAPLEVPRLNDPLPQYQHPVVIHQPGVIVGRQFNLSTSPQHMGIFFEYLKSLQFFSVRYTSQKKCKIISQ